MMRQLLLFPVLLLALLLSVTSGAEDLPQSVVQAGESYRQGLPARASERMTAAERDRVVDTAAILSRVRECRQALDLRRTVLAVEAGFAQWQAQGEDALCARDWQEAVGAFYHAYAAAREDPQRFRVLRRLGQAMQQHWRFDEAEALAVYLVALRYGSDAQLRAQVDRLIENQRQARGLRLEHIEVREQGNEPSLCLRFNHPMPPPADRAYGDFVRTEPRIDARFRLGDTQEICLDGGEFDREYRVVVLAGLADTEGRPLPETSEERVAVGPRTPSLRFQSHLYVLPRNAEGVPLHVVNAPGAELALYRIDERNLLAPEVRELFGSDLSSWSEDRIESTLGARIWNGPADWAVQPNREQRVLLPLGERLEARPGVYVLSARIRSDDMDDYASVRAAQWLVVSDLGISTYQGRDGLSVTVRGLGDAEPRAGVRLELLARNNSRLATTRTDQRGFARLPADALRGRGGQEPVLLFALHDDGDFSFLDISRSPFDLSDRGVGGRPHPGPLDAYVRTERGVYRPGEDVHVSVLLRDEAGQAAPELPLTLRLLRPDESQAWEQVVRTEAAGGAASTLRLPAPARTGRWKLLAHVDPEAAAVGEATFQVQAILPPRLEAAIEGLPDAPLPTGSEIEAEVRADYLFGAPAADLEVRSELQIAVDPNPFPAYPGFRFGPLDTGEDRIVQPLEDTRTDAQGRARLRLAASRLPARPTPLRAELRSEVIDVDGRVVTATAERLIDTGLRLLGLRVPGEPGPEGHVLLDEGAEARFEIVAATATGKGVVASGLEYRLVEERVHYQWYQEYGRWQYRREVRESEHVRSQFDVSDHEPTTLAFTLDWGRYRLDIRDPESGASASARVQLGWGGAAAPDDPPDRLQVTRDRSSYLPETVAAVTIESPFDGPGQLVIATDRVLDVLPFRLDQGRARLEIPVSIEWGAGAYALVTAFRPDHATAGLGPRRAIGVTWLGLDPEPSTLPVHVEALERARPFDELEVMVTVPKHLAGEEVFVTISVVDDGLLQLTRHPPPRPLVHFFGQRWLGVDIRDLYGRLLDGRQGQVGRIGTGADTYATDAALQPPVTIVSLFSGVVALDGEGRVMVPFRIPEFEGRVRVDALAWSARRMGQAGRTVTVRDPVVLQASLPRFLAAGDRGTATLTLFNIEGAEGDYRLHWRQRGALTATRGTQSFQLVRGERRVVTLPLLAADTGRGEFDLDLEGPEGLAQQRRIELTVRPAFARDELRQAGRLPGFESTVMGGQELRGMIPETVSGTVTLDQRPQWDVAGLLRQLDRYPYGCLEQVASRAFPLLDLPGLEAGSAEGRVAPQRLSAAVTQVLEKQLDNGSFTLWGGPGEPDEWVSVYALEFLGEARQRGTDVPDFAWDRGLRWLRGLAEYPETEDPRRMAAQSYALHVLARFGSGRPETARYLLETVGERLPSGAAAAHLGAALALDGDRARAQRAFRLAGQLERGRDLGDYGSVLRDRADILRLAATHAPDALDLGTRAAELATAFTERRWLSTQEQVALVRAAVALDGGAEPLDLVLGETRYQNVVGPLQLSPDPRALITGVELQNRAATPLWYALLAEGNPREPPAPQSRGLRIARNYFTLDGAPLEDNAVVQGEVVVAVLEGEALDAPDGERERHQLLIVDPLPAGLEADAPGLEGSRPLDGLDWIGDTSPTLYTDAFDDRFVAALDLEPGDARSFRVAYLLRAVTPGAYRTGPVFIEDMYKPYFRARGDSGWLHVHAAR